jgi:hypothetical protein
MLAPSAQPPSASAPARPQPAAGADTSQPAAGFAVLLAGLMPPPVTAGAPPCADCRANVDAAAEIERASGPRPEASRQPSPNRRRCRVSCPVHQLPGLVRPGRPRPPWLERRPCRSRPMTKRLRPPPSRCSAPARTSPRPRPTRLPTQASNPHLVKRALRQASACQCPPHRRARRQRPSGQLAS